MPRDKINITRGQLDELLHIARSAGMTVEETLELLENQSLHNDCMNSGTSKEAEAFVKVFDLVRPSIYR